MTPEQLSVEGLRVAVGLLVLIGVYRYVFHPAVTDYWRQNLFAIRNRLWDAMADADCLDTQAHHELRTRINALIRMAGNVNVLLVWMVRSAVARKAGVVESARFRSAVSEVHDPLARRALDEAARDLRDSFAVQVWFRSLPGAFVGLPVLAAYLLVWAIVRVVRRTTGVPLRVVSAAKCQLSAWWASQARTFEESAVAAGRAEDLAHAGG